MTDNGLRVDGATATGDAARHRRSRGLTVATTVLVIMMAAGQTGCSWVRNKLDPSNIDYRSAKTGPGLDVPPDLIGPKPDERYIVPEAGGGQTYSEYSRERREQGQGRAGTAVAVQPRAGGAAAATGAAGANAAASSTVLPRVGGARIERDGQARWLAVDEPPEQVWPQLVSFFESEGMPLLRESPALGTMETGWITRTDKPETTGLRGALTWALGTTYTTPIKDAYTTRIERAPNGGTEIYVSQRALEEVVNSSRQDSTIWQPGPNRPELEVEMLRRMLMRFGRVTTDQSRAAVAAATGPEPAAPPATAAATATDTGSMGAVASANPGQGASAADSPAGEALRPRAIDPAAAEAGAVAATAAGSVGPSTAVDAEAGVIGGAATGAAIVGAAASDRPAPPAPVVPAPERSAVITEADGRNALRVNNDFERAWREVGLAIDRVGFTVEDRDRSKGTYFVRYVDLDRRDPRQGALSRMFSGERKDLTGQRYQIRVEGDSPTASRVDVRDESGATPTSEADVRVANRIVALLHERMR